MSRLAPTNPVEPEPVPLPPRDVRAARSPALRVLLSPETLRSAARVLVLVALDIAGIYLAMLTAAAIKAFARDAVHLEGAFAEVAELAPLPCLVTLLLFAASRLYRHRGESPGLS